MQYQWCPYNFAVHISNEYCWILMLSSWVFSSDCIAAVESCITLCGIHGGWTGTEVDFFLHVLSFFSVCSWIHIFPCSHITASSYVWQHWPGRTLSPPRLLSFGLYLLMTQCYSHTSLFHFSFVIMLPQKIFMSISMHCLFCIIMMKLQYFYTDMLYRACQYWERYCHEETDCVTWSV
jgi:hypothetical protein